MCTRRPEIDAVVYSLGGLHPAQLLSELDLGLIAAHPQILYGYSGATSLLAAITALTGLITFYGPALLPCRAVAELLRSRRQTLCPGAVGAAFGIPGAPGPGRAARPPEDSPGAGSEIRPAGGCLCDPMASEERRKPTLPQANGS
jgi:hypothetical protein